MRQATVTRVGWRLIMVGGYPVVIDMRKFCFRGHDGSCTPLCRHRDEVSRTLEDFIETERSRATEIFSPSQNVNSRLLEFFVQPLSEDMLEEFVKRVAEGHRGGNWTSVQKPMN